MNNFLVSWKYERYPQGCILPPDSKPFVYKGTGTVFGAFFADGTRFFVIWNRETQQWDEVPVSRCKPVNL